MLSVIIPLYNCESYISDCLQSVFDQDYRDYEIIVVNDGSTDRSLEVVQAVRDDRISIVNQENRGLFHARISGLRAAKGEYCLFLDADDLLKADTLSTVNRWFEQGYDCVIYKRAEFWDNDIEHRTEKPAILPDQSIYEGDNSKELLEFLLTKRSISSIVCKAFRRSLVDVEKLSGYPRIASGEDALYTLELFTHTQHAVYLDFPCYYYRQRMGSISHTLTFNLYSDNVYRFNLYRQVARECFSDDEQNKVLSGIDAMASHLITSLSINYRYSVRNWETYNEIFGRISRDAFFTDLYQRAAKEQTAGYRVVLRLLKQGQIRVLYLIKKGISVAAVACHKG